MNQTDVCVRVLKCVCVCVCVCMCVRACARVQAHPTRKPLTRTNPFDLNYAPTPLLLNFQRFAPQHERFEARASDCDTQHTVMHTRAARVSRHSVMSEIQFRVSDTPFGLCSLHPNHGGTMRIVVGQQSRREHQRHAINRSDSRSCSDTKLPQSPRDLPLTVPLDGVRTGVLGASSKSDMSAADLGVFALEVPVCVCVHVCARVFALTLHSVRVAASRSMG